MRRFHRWFGVGSAIVVVLAPVTGLLWAYAPYLYWERGYLERKHPVPIADYSAVTLTPQDAIRVAREQLGGEAKISAVTLRSELGAPVYEVAGANFALLVDARAGTLMSPLSAEIAARIAAEYVPGRPTASSATLLDEFAHRSGKVHKAVYRVRFDAPNDPEIFISARNGAIIEEQDDARRFHFWIMRLHQLNFFGFKKTLTIIPGAAILLLVASGLVLSRRAKTRAARAQAIQVAP